MDLVLNDEYLLGNILSFLEIEDLRFTFCVCKLWMKETRYILRNTIVTPWMKTTFPPPHTNSQNNTDNNGMKYQFCVDRDRGIVVFDFLEPTTPLKLSVQTGHFGTKGSLLEFDPLKLTKIQFSSIYNPNLCVSYAFEAPQPKFTDVLKSVIKIQAKYTFENKNRYFLALDRHKSDSSVFQLIEFTDLNNIVSYYIEDENAYSKFAYGFPWFYHFIKQLNLPPYQKTHNIQILPQPLINDQGYSVVKSGYMNYDVYLDGRFVYFKSFDILYYLNERGNTHFGRYLRVKYPNCIIYYDILSEDHMKPILCYEFSSNDRLDFWSANEPFLFVVNQTQNRTNLINLEEKTCKTILPKSVPMALFGINHITVINNQKGKQLVFENYIHEQYHTPYQQQILEFE